MNSLVNLSINFTQRRRVFGAVAAAVSQHSHALKYVVICGGTPDLVET